MNSPLRFLTSGFSLCWTLIYSGCYSKVTEQRTFIATNRQDLALVQVSIKGAAKMADMKFRAGYRATSAVDEVLKGDTTPITIQGQEPSSESLNQSADAITTQLLEELKTSYENKEPKEKQEEIENRIVRARSLPRVIRSRETSSVPEAPVEKFVIAFSADPSKVFKAIADTTARNESEGAIFKSLLDVEQAARARATTQQELTEAEEAKAQSVLKQSWEALMVDVRSRLPDESADQTKANYDSLRTNLRAYEMLLENFIAIRP